MRFGVDHPDRSRNATWRVLKKAKSKLENVAIVNASQLKVARTTRVLFRFNYDAMPSLNSLNLSIAVL